MPTPNIDRAILDAMQTTLEAIPWVSKVETEDIVVAFDSDEYQIPMIQVFGNGQKFTHERNGRVKVEWSVIVELILKEDRNGSYNQRDLLDKRQDIEQAIGGNVRLGIPEVLNVLYLNNLDDIGLVRPFYVTQLEFSVEYHKTYAGFC
jgi:hypothetical protein